MLNYSQEVFRNLETSVGYAFPEIEVLAGLVVIQWYVAYHSEGNEFHAVDVTHLCDGAAFHVNSHGVGE